MSAAARPHPACGTPRPCQGSRGARQPLPCTTDTAQTADPSTSCPTLSRRVLCVAEQLPCPSVGPHPGAHQGTLVHSLNPRCKALCNIPGTALPSASALPSTSCLCRADTTPLKAPFQLQGVQDRQAGWGGKAGSSPELQCCVSRQGQQNMCPELRARSSPGPVGTGLPRC